MNNKDKELEKLLVSIEKQKTEIKELEKEIRGVGFVTNMRFSYLETDTFINLQTASVDKLIKVLGFIGLMHAKYNFIAANLKVNPEFLWCGFSFEDWKQDIETKIKKLSVIEKKKLLSKAEEVFKSKFSKEKKDENEINDWKDKLGL